MGVVTYHTFFLLAAFQGKPYLWGVFRPSKERFAMVEEHGIGHGAQEEMGKQHAADCGVGKKGHMVAGSNVGVGFGTPEEAEGQGMEQEQTSSVVRFNTQIPVEDAALAASAPTMTSTMSANNGHMASGLNMGVGLETPEEAEGQGMEQEQTPSVAQLNTQIPVEDAARATSAPTMTAALSANNGLAGFNMGVIPENPEEAEGQGIVQEQIPSVARPHTPIPVEDTARATLAPSMTATLSANNGHGATSAPTMPAAMSANDGQIHSSFSVPTGAMLGFVARQTPRLELLIEQMQREGAVVVVMRGEMIGSGLGQTTATG
jgi:hypothetical protein